jgi:hypothetical protein
LQSPRRNQKVEALGFAPAIVQKIAIERKDIACVQLISLPGTLLEGREKEKCTALAAARTWSRTNLIAKPIS